MNPLIQSKTTILPLLIVFVAVCLAPLPAVQASPPLKPEDRGNGNSAAENVSALNLSTTGGGNTAHGWYSLFSDTTGSFNTADGFQALYTDTSGRHNTANGFQALHNNTGGGGGPGMLSSAGSFNTATGSQSLFSNTVGYQNSAHGFQALYSNDSGRFNTATGVSALYSNTTGDANTATGIGALGSNTDGHDNVANGSYALFLNTSGHDNVANGNYALYSNTADGNTATGAAALYTNVLGLGNTATGYQALYHNSPGGNTTGNDNTATGYQALYVNTAGGGNTAVGSSALSGNVDGNGNTAIGALAGTSVRLASFVTCIGARVYGADVPESTWIGNVYGVGTRSYTTAPVVVSNEGQLGTAPSAERFKKDISTMEKASEAILALRPVTFHYKSDGRGTPQFGLIAEEVAKVNPALVLPDKEGKPYTVRYDAVNAMLLNEFLKEHTTVQEQGATIAELKKQIATLIAATKEQAAQIQKVSAQIEVTKLAPQVVNNDR